MTFTKSIRYDALGFYVRVVTSASPGSSLFFDRYATYTGELEQTSDFGSCKEQAEFVMSQIPDSFPLLPREHEALDVYRYKIRNGIH